MPHEQSALLVRHSVATPRDSAFGLNRQALLPSHNMPTTLTLGHAHTMRQTTDFPARIFMGMGFGLVSGRQLGQPWWRNRILVNFASAGKCHPEVTHTKQVPSRSNPNEATAGPPTEPEPGRSKDWRGEAAASRLAYSGPRVALARCRGATSPAGGWPPRPGCSVQPRPSPQAPVGCTSYLKVADE